MTLTCPRDGTELQSFEEHSIPCDRCPQCSGEWMSLDGLQALEATVASGAALAGTIEYCARKDEIKCPSCGQNLRGFDFRGEDLELDACEQQHGFWLDSGEAERVRKLMRARMNDMQRVQGAEAAWNQARTAGFKPTLTDRLEHIFFGKRGL